MKIRLLALFVFFLLIDKVGFGQGAVDGNPVSVDWVQINTDTVRVIFPDYLRVKAQRVSDYIHHLAKHNTESLGGDVRKISIVLQSNTSTPNGYVSVAPFKSEFYCTNPQDPYMVGGSDFVDVLSVHEYRHALQFANTKQGFANVLYLFQGEMGWSMISNVTIPNWFFEGDAVLNETAVTNGGRGRLSSFQKNNRANWYANKNFKYKHIRMGSFKSQMPDHYEYGYLLCSYLRDEYGNDIWAKVLHNTMRLRHIIYPFSNSLRMHTGMSTRELYDKAYASNKEKYRDLIAETKIIEGDKLSKDVDDITNYTFPTYYGEDLYCLKSSYSTIPEIVKISSGGEETHICNPGVTANDGFSIANGKIVWSEATPHPRWANYNYSDIVIYDIESGEKKKLSYNAKYFSPELTDDASRIVVVEYTKEGVCKLLVLDSQTGRVLTTVENKDNDYIMYPKWINNNRIICSARKKGKFNITVFDLGDNTEKTIWGPMNQVVTDIEFINDKCYFSATFSDMDNIYSLNINDKTISQLTSVPVGAFWPTVSKDGETLVYSNYTAKGNELRRLNLSEAVNKTVKPIPLHKMECFNNMAIASEGGDIIDSANHRNDEVKKYNKLKNLINVHSWGFTSSNEEYGISLKSDNALNTLGVGAAYVYNRNEKSSSVNANITYAGLWVKTIASFSTQFDREDSFLLDKYNDKSGDLSFVLPLNLSSGLYYRGLSIESGFSIHDIDYKERNSNLSFSDYHFGLSFYNLRRSAYKNIGRRWGQSFSASYHKSFKRNVSEELELKGRLFFPGLLMNHNFELSSAYKWKGGDYSYTDLFAYSRGYSTLAYKDILGISLDYNLPLAYCEFGLNGVFYTNRLSAKLFGDYNITNLNENKREYASVGCEMTFDVLLFNFLNFNLGFRQSFLLNKDYDVDITGDSKFEFVFRTRL